MQNEIEQEDTTLAQRVRQNPGPAARWGVVLIALVALEFGALMSAVMTIPYQAVLDPVFSAIPILGDILASIASVFANIGDTLASIPTLLDRSVIPNQGYYIPGEGWKSTFLFLSPKHAWLLRLLLVYAYAFFFLYWLWRGYLVFRRHYRFANWTPTDDIIDRFRGHTWGEFGLVIVAIFLILAIFAPTVSPTTKEATIMDPYGHSTTYYDTDTNSVETIPVAVANLNSRSIGVRANVGIWSYDQYGRFHPFGTLTMGKDLFTFMAYGARVSLFIALFASLIAGGIALGLALLTAYYKGIADLSTVVLSDAFSAMPQLLVLIMLVQVLSGHWISEVYNGAFLLALLFGIWGWMYLWRAVRGPAFQVVENDWVLASEGFGERPWRIVKKHVSPYVISYLIIYLSMSVGGIIIGTASLSFLGLGVLPPTPEWGRAISNGQNLLRTPSWHISIVPGVAITLLVLGLNAFGDGVRDAIDPKSESGDAAAEAATTGGG